MTDEDAKPRIEYRPARPSDLAALHKLDRICFPPEVAFSPDIFMYHLEDDMSINIVAEEGSEIVGFVIGDIEDDAGRIITMDVRPNRRRLGIGIELMRRVEASMKAHGARRSVLEAAVDNLAAITLYAKMGYFPLGVIRGYYPHPPPKGTDAIHMEKRFE